MYIDVTVGVILSLFVFYGYKKGIIAEFISFAALIFNIVFSKKITPVIFNMIKAEGKNESIVNTGIYALVFIVTYILLNVTITFILRTLKKNSKMRLDSIIGALFGLLKGLIVTLLLLVVLIVSANFNENIELKLERSISYKVAKEVIEGVKVLLPEDIRNVLDQYSNKKDIDKVLEDFLNKEK